MVPLILRRTLLQRVLRPLLQEVIGSDFTIRLSLFSHDNDGDVEEEVVKCCVSVCLCFSHKDGYEKFSDWKKLWTGNGKSEPSLKAFMADQQLPYWVRRVFLLRLMRALVKNTATFFYFIIIFFNLLSWSPALQSLFQFIIMLSILFPLFILYTIYIIYTL